MARSSIVTGCVLVKSGGKFRRQGGTAPKALIQGDFMVQWGVVKKSPTMFEYVFLEKPRLKIEGEDDHDPNRVVATSGFSSTYDSGLEWMAYGRHNLPNLSS